MFIINTSKFKFREATVIRAIATGEWISDVTYRTAGESAITFGEEEAVIRQGEGRGENKGGENGGKEEKGGGGKVGERHLE